MTSWNPMEDAPHDRPVLVKYDHDADPYFEPEKPHRLTDYAANAEMGDYLTGKGVVIAHWCDKEWESEDEYGSGYWIPACWLCWFNGDYMETVVNATGWQELPEF